MGAQTAIQWCDSTFNPWRGCARVHTGCAKCYAERMSKRNPGVLGVWGPNGTRVVAAEKTWSEPLKWDKAAAKAGERHRVFCASLADVFEDWQGPMVSSGGDRLFACVKCGHWGTSLLICEQCLDEDKWHLRQPVFMDDVRFKLFRMIDATPNLDWQLLTKRPENVTKMWPGGGFRKNVWLLTSVSDQQTVTSLATDPTPARFTRMRETINGMLDIMVYVPRGCRVRETFPGDDDYCPIPTLDAGLCRARCACVPWPHPSRP